MEIIHVKPYSHHDKVNICKNFLVPELLESINIDKGSITMTSPAIDHIINNYTMEPGVRALRNKCDKIFLKLNIDRIWQRGIFKTRNDFSWSRLL